jgi:hypothetical protein
MTRAERSAACQLTELWETTWSQVVGGSVDALRDVVARFEETAPGILAAALQEVDESIVHRWHEQAQSQLMQYDGRQHITGPHDDQETGMSRCIQEAERQGLAYDKVAAYGTPGDPYAYADYAHDHPEDPVAAQLLRCLAAVESGSQAGPEALEQRQQAIGELRGAVERVWIEGGARYAQGMRPQGASRNTGVLACSLCGSTALVGSDGRCGPCRALVAASQAAGEPTEQGWAVDPDTVVSWGDLAGHVPVLAGLLPAGQVDPALQEFLRMLIESWQEVVRVVQAVVEGGEPPTPEMMQRLQAPFVQAFGSSGASAYTGAAFGGFAAAHSGAWAPDPAQEARQGMREAARDALGALLPGGEGLASAIDDWLDRLGLKPEEKDQVDDHRFVKGSHQIGSAPAGSSFSWECRQCGMRWLGNDVIDDMDRECPAAPDRCRKCGRPRQLHKLV